MGHVINPSTGALTFNNTPSTVSDLQAGADRTEQIGTAWVGTVAELEDIEYPREGEVRRVRADGSYWGFDGTGWELIYEETAWQTPTLAGTWANVGGSQATRYRRVNGHVEAEGLIAGGATGSTIFTFEPGYRPAAGSYFLVMANVAAAQLRVDADGTLKHVAWVAGGTNALLSLSDIPGFAAAP